MWSHDVKLLVVCVAVLLHTTTGRCISCHYPQNSRSKIRRDEDGDVVVLQIPSEQKTLSDHYDIKTEPPPAPKKVAKRKGCCPYEFDSSNCRTGNDRVQCGYDKNVGGLSPDEIQKELSGGCRLRFGRIECGYWYPPYVNVRRPLAWDNPPPVIMQPVGFDRNGPQKLKMVKASSNSPSNTRNRKLVSKFVNTLEMLDSSKVLRLRKSPENNYSRVQQRNGPRGNQINCVEIDDRIVCKPI
ncbi:uncharacterized protein LOC113230880 [Hyposmocoma kahamanoa]|uniref:uncharacterized protein LOC113230880 n=1 Tax=Hyposmocoma kahamanoa TaxID=1477025 RepID=UPI000E6D9D8F|nr:uncharacterized protein LOC113230880 [Hyposmocoma kahamanoa]